MQVQAVDYLDADEWVVGSAALSGELWTGQISLHTPTQICTKNRFLTAGVNAVTAVKHESKSIGMLCGGMNGCVYFLKRQFGRGEHHAESMWGQHVISDDDEEHVTSSSDTCLLPAPPRDAVTALVNKSQSSALLRIIAGTQSGRAITWHVNPFMKGAEDLTNSDVISHVPLIGERVADWTLHQGRVHGLHLRDDELLSVGQDLVNHARGGTLKVWHVTGEHKPVQTLVFPFEVYAVDRHPAHEHLIALGLEDDAVATYDLRHLAQPVDKRTLFDAPVKTVKFHASRDWLAVGSDDNTTAVIDLQSPQLKYKSQHTRFVRAVCWHGERELEFASTSWAGDILFHTLDSK
jgi:WD40 repeat protein